MLGPQAAGPGASAHACLWRCGVAIGHRNLEAGQAGGQLVLRSGSCICARGEDQVQLDEACGETGRNSMTERELGKSTHSCPGGSLGAGPGGSEPAG